MEEKFECRDDYETDLPVSIMSLSVEDLKRIIREVVQEELIKERYKERYIPTVAPYPQPVYYEAPPYKQNEVWCSTKADNESINKYINPYTEENMKEI